MRQTLLDAVFTASRWRCGAPAAGIWVWAPPETRRGSITFLKHDVMECELRLASQSIPNNSSPNAGMRVWNTLSLLSKPPVSDGAHEEWQRQKWEHPNITNALLYNKILINQIWLEKHSLPEWFPPACGLSQRRSPAGSSVEHITPGLEHPQEGPLALLLSPSDQVWPGWLRWKLTNQHYAGSQRCGYETNLAHCSTHPKMTVCSITGLKVESILSDYGCLGWNVSAVSFPCIYVAFVCFVVCDY